MKKQMRDSSYSNKQLHSYLDSIFDKYDHNGNGLMGQNQVRYMIMEMASHRKPDATKEEIETYVFNYMKNVEGQLTREQFHRRYFKK